MLQESETFAHSLGDIPKGNPRWVVCKRKMDKVGTENDYWNACFFIVINISPCHGNPRRLPTLIV